MKCNSLLLASVIVAVCGCATSSPIQQYSASKSSFKSGVALIDHSYDEKDIYRIYHKAATGFVSIQSIRQTAEQRAEDFASRQGKSIVILGERTSDAPYILGNFPRIEIVFALLPEEASSEPVRDKYADIERLKKLLDDGALTQKEYDREKTKILE